MSDAYEKFIRSAHGLLLFLAIVAMVGFCVLEHTVIERLEQLRQPITDLGRTIVVVGAASGDLEKTLRIERDAATGQIAATTAAAQSLTATATAAQNLIAHLDTALDDPQAGLLPQLAGAVHDQNAQLVALERQATADLAELQTSADRLNGILANAGTASGNLASLTADPNIALAFKEFSDALDKANAILVQLDAIAASGNRDAAMLEAKLRDALKPASLAKKAFMGLLGIAGPAAQIATAAK